MNETNLSAEMNVTEKKRPYSRLAIASLFVGLGVFVFLLVWLNRYPSRFYWPGLVGIAFASMAALRLEKIHRRGGGFIAAGMILCGLAFLLHNPLVQAKALADMVKCADQLGDIDKAIALYQSGHDGLNPPTLDILVEQKLLDPEKLVCPCRKGKDTCSYIYRGGDLNAKVPGSMVVAYDCYGNHDIADSPSSQVQVLFAEGRVKFYDEENMWEILEEDNQLRRRHGFSEKPMEMMPRYDREGFELPQSDHQEPTP